MLACLILVAGGTWVCRDSLVEGWCRIQLRHGTGSAAYRAAARLSRGSRRSSILVRDWALETAGELAGKVPAGEDPVPASQRDDILVPLVRIHLLRGDVRTAEALSASIRFQLWARVTPATLRTGSHGQTDFRIVRKLVMEVAASGDILGALRLAGAAEEFSIRFDGIDDVLEGLGISEPLAGSLEVLAASIDPCGEDRWALHSIAILQARRGDLEGAFRTSLRTERLLHPGREGAPHVMELLASAGEVEKAREVADLYVEKEARAVVLARLARGLAEGGRRDAARRELDAALSLIEELPGIEYPSQDPRAVPLTEAARTWWKLGDAKASRECYRRAALLTGSKNGHLVTQTQARNGDTEGARETAAALAAHGRYPGFEHAARVEATEGRFDDALSIAKKLEDPGLFAEIGAGQRRRGHSSEASVSFERAFALAAAIPAHVGGSPSRVNAYRRCAREEGRSGSSEGTIAAALAESIPLFRASLLLGMAEGIEERLAGR